MNPVTPIVPIHNVEIVTTLVLLVPEAHKDLAFVPLTELTMLKVSVFAEKDTMPLTDKLTAQFVMILVLLVKVMPDVVLLVLNREPSNNGLMLTLVLVFVNVTTDIMKTMKENVLSVIINVYLVKPSKTTVSNVTVTESMLTIVDVQIILMTMVPQFVQIVLKNV
jgi:hypothetical protein